MKINGVMIINKLPQVKRVLKRNTVYLKMLTIKAWSKKYSRRKTNLTYVHKTQNHFMKITILLINRLHLMKIVTNKIKSNLNKVLKMKVECNLMTVKVV